MNSLIKETGGSNRHAEWRGVESNVFRCRILNVSNWGEMESTYCWIVGHWSGLVSRESIRVERWAISREVGCSSSEEEEEEEEEERRRAVGFLRVFFGF